MGEKDKHLALWLFFILLVGFLFFFSGVPGTDDEQLFASASQSYAITGRFSADQVYGNERLQGFYPNIAPLHTWLGSIAYRFAALLRTGGLQCFFLLSPFYSALTGYLLVKIAQGRGYSKSTICVAVFIFGFATMVFAYSKTYFREPLAMLLITASFYEMDYVVNDKTVHSKDILRIFASFILLVLAIWTKEFLIICFPLFLGYHLILKRKNSSGFPAIKLNKTQNLTILVISSVFIIFLGFILSKDGIGRFTISYLSRLVTYLANLEHEHFFSSLWRSFFSLSKGFLVYSPIFMLVAISPFLVRKQLNRHDYILALGSSVGVAALQVFFYDDAWWTFTWSTRFLLPIIPFWIIALFPFVGWLLDQNRKWIRTLFFLLLILSFMLQLGSVLISSADFSQFVMDQYHLRLSETNSANLAAIPAVGHWLAFFAGVISDVSWMRIVQSGNLLGLVISAISIIFILFVLLIINKFSKFSNQFQNYLPPTILGLIFLLPIVILFGNKGDPYYAGNQVSYQDLTNTLSNKVVKDDLVLIDAYNQPLWYFYFNFGFPNNNWVGLPPAHPSMNSNLALYPEMEKTLEFILRINKSSSYLWLATERNELSGETNYLDAFQRSGFSIFQELAFYQHGQIPLVWLDQYKYGS